MPRQMQWFNLERVMQHSPRENVADTDKETGILYQAPHVPSSWLGGLHAFAPGAGSSRNTLLPPVTSQLTQILPGLGDPTHPARSFGLLQILLNYSPEGNV